MKGWISSSNPVFQSTMQFYERHERFVPVVSFFAGFSWDSFTLTRIDRMVDNLILLTYLLLLAGFIVLFNLENSGRVRQKLVQKYSEWIPVGIQFFLGGLFSAYVIFYFQSASFTKTGLFLIILVGLLVANEFLKSRLTNIYFQIALYFLVAFSFFIFFLPVLLKVMNVFMFIAGGILSLALVCGIVYFLYRMSAVKSREQHIRLYGLVGGMYLLMNLFYWMNWIPPVPLSARYGGIFHSVERQGELYEVSYEKPAWYEFFKDSDDVYHFAPGDTVHCFASVFAPAGLETRIVYHWQQYSTQKKDWLTTDKVGYNIVGGRQGGYRGHTYKRHVSPGEWRIDIETEDGLLLKQIDFEIADGTGKIIELTQDYR